MKLLFSIVLLLFFCTVAKSQSIFKSQPLLATTAVPKADSMVNAFRFGVAVSPGGLTLSGVYQAAAGLELGIQHEDYNYATQVYTVLYSVNLVWIPVKTGQPIHSLSDLTSFGFLFGPNLKKLLGINSKNIFQIGPFYNTNTFYNTPTPPAFKDRFGFWVVGAINLNN